MYRILALCVVALLALLAASGKAHALPGTPACDVAWPGVGTLELASSTLARLV